MFSTTVDNTPKSGIEKLGIFVGVVLVANNISFIHGVASVYYALMAFALVCLLLKVKAVKVAYSMLFLYAACFASILFNDIPALFNPYQRFLSFLLMTILLSPFITSPSFTVFRSQVLVCILSLLRYVILGSVIAAMLGMGYERIYFQGITSHSMLLGPFASLCLLFCIYQFTAEELPRKKKRFYIVLILCSLFCLIQAASRTAFIACIVAAAVFLAIYFRRNMQRYFRLVIGIGIAAALSFPLWGRYLDKLEAKNSGNIKSLSVESREEHWAKRIIEFKSNPVIGIGFASVDITNLTGSNFSDNGQIETGSSWLSSLSMTGVCGFVAMVIVFAGAIMKTWRLRDYTPQLTSLLISMLTFWIFHMMAEGYIFAGGSSMFFCVWILLGVMYGVSQNPLLADELQQKLYK